MDDHFLIVHSLPDRLKEKAGSRGAHVIYKRSAALSPILLAEHSPVSEEKFVRSVEEYSEFCEVSKYTTRK